MTVRVSYEDFLEELSLLDSRTPQPDVVDWFDAVISLGLAEDWFNSAVSLGLTERDTAKNLAEKCFRDPLMIVGDWVHEEEEV